jgi:hypothetical protein
MALHMQGGQLSEVEDAPGWFPQDPWRAHAGSCIEPCAPASSSGLYGPAQAGDRGTGLPVPSLRAVDGMRASVQEIALPAAGSACWPAKTILWDALN